MGADDAPSPAPAPRLQALAASVFPWRAAHSSGGSGSGGSGGGSGAAGSAAAAAADTSIEPPHLPGSLIVSRGLAPHLYEPPGGLALGQGRGVGKGKGNVHGNANGSAAGKGAKAKDKGKKKDKDKARAGGAAGGGSGGASSASGALSSGSVPGAAASIGAIGGGLVRSPDAHAHTRPRARLRKDSSTRGEQGVDLVDGLVGFRPLRGARAGRANGLAQQAGHAHGHAHGNGYGALLGSAGGGVAGPDDSGSGWAGVDHGRGLGLGRGLGRARGRGLGAGALGAAGASARDERARPRHWTHDLFRPSHATVARWLDSWATRWGILAVAPSCIVWFWCAVPFPKSDPYDPAGPWCAVPNPPPWCAPAPSLNSAAASSISARASSFMAGSARAAAAALARHAPSLSYALYTRFVAPSADAGAHAELHAGTPPPANQVDANFWFFLIFYYGMYCAVGLIYITQLFSLYRLNWWPAALGARTSYTFFWLASLLVGWALHQLDPLGSEQRRHDRAGGGGGGGGGQPLPPDQPEQQPLPPSAGDLADEVQWQRKTMWVALAFATMAMPALVCFAGLRRSGRQTYRHSLTDLQKTFLERQLARRIPSSYIRFLWFMLVIGLALSALVAGQGYASVYLSTLPHTGFDGTAYVTFWALTVNVLAIASHWMLEEKIRSRALVFVFKYYYFLVYFIFYRNLFARLRSFDQFALIQLLSSFWVCIWYPFSMSNFAYRMVEFFNPQPRSWEEYVEGVGLAFYLRNLAQNATMLAFLGWVSILHFGPNQQLYPFFAFDDKRDPYNYQLTIMGASAIWGSELLSSYVAREICKFTFGVDVTNLGLDEMRQYPEIVPTCLWTSVHVLMDMLLFLIKLNFQ